VASRPRSLSWLSLIPLFFWIWAGFTEFFSPFRIGYNYVSPPSFPVQPLFSPILGKETLTISPSFSPSPFPAALNFLLAFFPSLGKRLYFKEQYRVHLSLCPTATRTWSFVFLILSSDAVPLPPFLVSGCAFFWRLLRSRACKFSFFPWAALPIRVLSAGPVCKSHDPFCLRFRPTATLPSSPLLMRY